MPMSLDDFQNAIEDSDGEYYGEYSGRGFFKGYAGTFEFAGDLIKLGAYLQEMALDDPPVEGVAELLKQSPHIDSMGRGLVIAWPLQLFEEANNG